jgi:hypothetical protein
MKTLLLYSAYTDQMSYFDDWIDAFKEHASYCANCINVFDNKNDYRNIRKFIEIVDLVVIHHSMNGDTLKYLVPFVSALKHRKGKLVSFVGNEVNLPTIGMASKIKILKELETEIIATQLLQEAGEWLYSDCNKSKVVSLPHALNSKVFCSTLEHKNRKIDIGTRSARYGVYIGDNDRNNIIDFFQKNAKEYGLLVDLGLDEGCQKRFNRKEWVKFLSSCKATLSTEAGSFYLEKDDILVRAIQKYLWGSSNKFVLPKETVLRKLYQKIVPSFLRKIIVNMVKNKIIEVDSVDQDFDFKEIYEKFFLNYPKCPVYSKAISSRHFDAIGTKTLHVMYPGKYNNILISGEHYFELKHDHSNLDKVVDLLNDFKTIQEMTNRTYDYVMSEHTHKIRLDYLLTKLN